MTYPEGIAVGLAAAVVTWFVCKAIDYMSGDD